MNVKFKQFPSSVKLAISQSNNAKMALNRLEHGSSETPRSWFMESRKPEDVLAVLKNQLSGMKDLEHIRDYDLSKSDKFGPQGEAAPLNQRLESFDEYFSHISTPGIVNDPVWKLAKAQAVRRLRFNESGAPVSAKAVLDRGLAESKYDTSSGYPLWKKRKTDVALAHAEQHYHDAIEERYPSTLGARASMGKTKENARHIFMASMDTNVAGQRYQQPLQDYIRSLQLDFFLPWEGWDKVQEAISQSWDSKSLKFGTDYTKMDQHFNKYHGLEVYDVIKHYFRKEFWAELKRIIVNVFTLPIITNLGYVDQDHAMPSGSEWTNFLETMWNYIFTIYLELKYHLNFKLRMGIGDDQLWILLGNWTPKQIKWILNTVVQEFDFAGLPGNLEKQEVGLHQTSFLQRFLDDSWNGLNGETKVAGVYSLIRNVTSQMFPEFMIRLKSTDPKWNDLFPIRVIQIAENAKHHPLFSWYIREIVAKANPNILEFVRKQLPEVKRLWDFSKRLQRLVPSYVGATTETKPLWEYETFKALRALA